MGGELTLSNFRYTTTNNNDFVIGDPTDSIGLTQAKYLVFQTSTQPGYLNNPYIGIVPSTDFGTGWKVVLSNGSGSITNDFVYSNIDNTFIGNNSFTFNGLTPTATTFSNNVIMSPAVGAISNSFVCNINATFNQGMTVYNTAKFNTDVHIIGTLFAGAIVSVVESSSMVSAKTIITNVTGTIGATASSAGSGLQVGGDSGAILASVITSTTTTVSDTWSLIGYNKQAMNFVGDSSYQMTFSAASTLTADRSYAFPNISGTVVLDTTIPSSTITLTGAVTGTGTGTVVTTLASSQTAPLISWSGLQYISNTTVSTDTAHGALVVIGGIASGNNINALGIINGNTLNSRVATGTAPITVNSTTPVANLTSSFVNMTTSSANASYPLVYTSAANTLNSGSSITFNPSTGMVNAVNLIVSGISSQIGGLYVGSNLIVSGISSQIGGVYVGSNSAGSISVSAAAGLNLVGIAGTISDFAITGTFGPSPILSIPAGLNKVLIAGNLQVTGSITSSSSVPNYIFSSGSSPVSGAGMFGIGVSALGGQPSKITPTGSGYVEVTIEGYVTFSTGSSTSPSNSTISLYGYWGLGTPPAQGAAVPSGANSFNDIVFTIAPNSTSITIPYCSTIVLPLAGMSTAFYPGIGTQIWLDIALGTIQSNVTAHSIVGMIYAKEL